MRNNTLQKEKQRQRRKELRQIESILHPCPIFNGVEISHEHLTNGKIHFTAWKDGKPINNKHLAIHRMTVLNSKEGSFYSNHANHIKWLLQGKFGPRLNQ